jgi:hypothetical protein
MVPRLLGIGPQPDLEQIVVASTTAGRDHDWMKLSLPRHCRSDVREPQAERSIRKRQIQMRRANHASAGVDDFSENGQARLARDGQRPSAVGSSEDGFDRTAEVARTSLCENSWPRGLLVASGCQRWVYNDSRRALLR